MKKVTPTAYYVRIDPTLPRWGRSTVEEEKATCEEIVEQLKRHVYAEVVAETEATCSHCGCRWSEEGTGYNGGCCDEDEKNAPSLLPGAKL